MGELININKNIGFKHTVFPDTQSHVQLDELILNSKVVFITCSLINTETLFKLLLVNDALEQEGITEKYLLGTNKLSSTIGTFAATIKYLSELKFKKSYLIIIQK